MSDERTTAELLAEATGTIPVMCEGVAALIEHRVAQRIMQRIKADSDTLDVSAEWDTPELIEWIEQRVMSDE